MYKFNISPLDKVINEKLQKKIDSKTKPLGSLGVLEKIAFQIGRIQNTLNPKLINPAIVIFAGDHGIAKEGVSAYPQEVTYQMVLNFLSEGAAINVFTKQNNIEIKIVDSGVNFNFDKNEKLIDVKIDYGTKNYLYEKAMSKEQLKKSIKKGTEIINNIFKNGSNIIGFGEMGIGNTSSASLITSIITEKNIDLCIGAGTGHNLEGLNRKKQILKKVLEKHRVNKNNYLEILQTFGGFEIAMMVGAFLAAAQNKMIILVDGFITTSALLIASKINQNILDYCIFSHCSMEPGHQIQIDYLNVKPVLNLNMRLGEGSGAAVCYPIIKSAILFLEEMASFEEAKVSK